MGREAKRIFFRPEPLNEADRLAEVIRQAGAGRGEAAYEAGEGGDAPGMKGEVGDEAGGTGLLAAEIEPDGGGDRQIVTRGIADGPDGEHGDGAGSAKAVDGGGLHIDGEGAGVMAEAALAGGGLQGMADGDELASAGGKRGDALKQRWVGEIAGGDDVAYAEIGGQGAAEARGDPKPRGVRGEELPGPGRGGVHAHAGVEDGDLVAGERAGEDGKTRQAGALPVFDAPEEVFAFFRQGEAESNH